MKMRRHILAAAAAILFCALPAAAQNVTTVSATVIDPKGIPYTYSSVSFQLTSLGGANPTIGNSPIGGFVGPISTDANGYFNVDLFTNSVISPSGTKWRVTICISGQSVIGYETQVQAPLGFGNQCFTPPDIIVSGTTQDLTNSINPYAPVLFRIPYTRVYINHTFIGQEVGIDFIPGAGVTLSGTDVPSSFKTTVTINAAGGSGCTLPGHDTGILSEHPVGTCFDSVDATWDDGSSKQNLQIGLSNTVTNQQLAYILGNNSTASSDTAGSMFNTELFGDYLAATLTQGANSLMGDTYMIGGGTGPSRTQTVKVSNGGAIFQVMCLIRACENDSGAFHGIQATGNGGSGDTNINVVFSVGRLNDITAASLSNTSSIFSLSESSHFNSASGCNVSDIFHLGEVNTVSCSTAAAADVDNSVLLGFSSTYSSTTHSLTHVYGLGDAITATQSSGANISEIFMVGDALALSNCSHCFAIGEHITSSASNQISFGLNAVPGLVITSASSHDNVQRSPLVFASLPACAGGTEGSFAAITDSTVNTWGTTIAGSGTNHVLGYCDGTNWTVAGK